MFLDCNKMSTICDKAQYKEATLWEKMLHTIHVFLCKPCRKYTKGNVKLTQLVNQSKTNCLDEAEKAKMKKAVETELSNN